MADIQFSLLVFVLWSAKRDFLGAEGACHASEASCHPPRLISSGAMV